MRVSPAQHKRPGDRKKNMNIEIIETFKGPLDPAPRVSVMVDGQEFSEARLERGWLIAEIPDEEEGYREIRGKGIRDLRVRAGAALA